MKVSLVTTVLNEEETIVDFLDSVAAQTRKPDEVIVVDGGSTDNTVQLIKSYPKLSIKLLQKPGNIARGRNAGIKSSQNEIIAVTDIGCSLDKDWFKRIIEPLEDKEVQVVAGYYLPVAKTPVQKLMAVYTSVLPEDVDPKTFLPSSRSIAFRKKTWDKVGGYPENLNYAEDLVFARHLEKAGMKRVFVREALVYWPQKRTISEALRQVFRYASGDGQAGPESPHFAKKVVKYGLSLVILLAVVLVRPSLIILVLIVLGVFSWRNLLRHASFLGIEATALGFVFYPLLGLSVAAGFSYGLVKRFKQE